MNFDEHKAEDFLQEESFLNYCLARNEEDVKYWKAWINANPHKELEVKQAMEMYHVINGQLSARQYRDDENAFKTALDNYKQQETLHVPAAKRTKSVWLYAAAAAAVISGIIFIYRNFNNKIASPAQAYILTTKPGERKSFSLPDGSSIQLNSGSAVTVTENFNTSTREIVLDGEGFFDVKHMAGKPFIVHTRDMDVKVLGTVFNINAYGDEEESETSLIKGSVEVTLVHDNNRKVILVPNQKITFKEKARVDTLAGNNTKGYSQGLMRKNTNLDIAEEAVWTKNQIVFNDEHLEEIARKLERWFDVSIVIEREELKKYRFTATFEDKSLTEILDALKLSRNFSYEINGKLVKLDSGGEVSGE